METTVASFFLQKTRIPGRIFRNVLLAMTACCLLECCRRGLRSEVDSEDWEVIEKRHVDHGELVQRQYSAAESTV
jgi:hypothetical protein